MKIVSDNSASRVLLIIDLIGLRSSILRRRENEAWMCHNLLTPTNKRETGFNQIEGLE